MRLYFVAVAGVLSVAAANAGQIQIGGVNGLTSAYINQTAGAGQNACAAGAGNCLAGSAGSFSERGYDLKLFSTATENGTPPTPYPTYVQGTAEVGTLGPFAMINDGTIGNPAQSKNFWDGLGTTAIVVPVGINNVVDVQTMLENVWGPANTTDTVVTFDFGTSSNASTFNNVVVVDLVNSGTGGTSGNGQLGNALTCATTSICTLSNGTVAAVSTPNETLNGGAVSNNLTVDAQNLFTSGNAFNGFTTMNAFMGASGNLNLYAQDFLLSSLVAPSSSEYLVNIQIQELSGASTGSNASQTALSAITVDTLAPEPSTVMLFLSGFGALGIARFRRRRK